MQILGNNIRYSEEKNYNHPRKRELIQYIFYFYTMKKTLLGCFILISFQFISAQKATTRKDTLQGGLRPERTCFDVLHYDLNIKVNPDDKSIVGYNEITFGILENTSRIQLDLFENMQVDSIIYKNKRLNYTREFIYLFSIISIFIPIF